MSDALIIRRLSKAYVPGKPVLHDIDVEIAARRHHRDHRAVGHRQEHADPLHQPSRRADVGRDPVRRHATSRALSRRGAAPCAPADRHGVPGIQPGRAPDGDGEPAVRPPGLRVAVARVAAQVSAGRHRARASTARHRGPRGLRQPARRCAVRRPAAARRHRARRHAAAATDARRRADVVARSEDVGRDHGTAGRRRAIASDSGAHQHARRRARAALCRSHRRHVRRTDRVRRSAARLVGRDAEADLRRRGLARIERSREPAAIAAYRFPASRAAQITFALLAVYVVYAVAQLDVSLGTRRSRASAHAGALPRPDVPAELRALGTAVEGPGGKPADRRARVGARHRARAAVRACSARAT